MWICLSLSFAAGQFSWIPASVFFLSAIAFLCFSLRSKRPKKAVRLPYAHELGVKATYYWGTSEKELVESGDDSGFLSVNEGWLFFEGAESSFSLHLPTATPLPGWDRVYLYRNPERRGGDVFLVTYMIGRLRIRWQVNSELYGEVRITQSTQNRLSREHLENLIGDWLSVSAAGKNVFPPLAWHPSRRHAVGIYRFGSVCMEIAFALLLCIFWAEPFTLFIILPVGILAVPVLYYHVNLELDRKVARRIGAL